MKTKYCIKEKESGIIAITSSSYWIVEMLFNFYDTNRYILATFKIDI
jgi:hypothetical protein